MQVILYRDARAFLARVREYLEAAEALNNLLLGISLRLGPQAASALLVAVEEEGGELVLAGIMTLPRKLNLYSHLPDPQAPVEALVRQLCCTAWQVPGVVAMAPLARAFAQAWKAATGCACAPGMSMGLYQLRQVQLHDWPPGQLRAGRAADLELLSEWAMQFELEVWKRPQAAQDAEEARHLVEGKIAAQDLHVWEVEGQPVSMASSARPTRYGVVVNLVYTPPLLRGKGYARACVAALSQRLLDRGFTFCTLFTDLDNPVSNRLYQQVGYQWLTEFAEYKFA
jgi:predicted GNAT family acetyltransferase